MKLFRGTIKFKDGSVQYVHVRAKDKDAAKREVDRFHFRRESRRELTMQRLEQAKETGEPGLLAIPPGLGGKALTETWVKAETERRERDLARYDSDHQVLKVEEVG